MPSPLAHSAMGYFFYHAVRAKVPQEKLKDATFPYGLLLVTVGLSLMPDMDAIPGILLGNLNGFHNNITHSLFVGLVVALIVGSIFWLRRRDHFWVWFLTALFCYEAHVLMDFFTPGRGLILLWPFSFERYAPPVMLFYGLHRSDGWLTVRHVWTFITELGFVLFLQILVTLLFIKDKDTT